MAGLLIEYMTDLYLGIFIGLEFRYRALRRKNRYVIFNGENGKILEHIDLDDETKEFENRGIKLTDGEKNFRLEQKTIKRLYKINNANNNLENTVRD